jgi:hypothetical protein
MTITADIQTAIGKSPHRRQPRAMAATEPTTPDRHTSMRTRL